MEFIEVLSLAVVSIVGASFLVFLFKIYPNKTKSKGKKPVKEELDELVKSQVRQIQENSEIQIHSLRKINQGLQNKINRIQGLYDKIKARQLEDDEDEEEDNDELLSKYDIDWPKALQYGQQMGLQTQGFDMNNVALKELVQEKILDNSEVAIALGILRPRSGVSGQNTNQQTGNQPNSIDTQIAEYVQQGGQLA